MFYRKIDHPSPSHSARTVMPPKQKIMSILDRARSAMEESYGYEEPTYEVAPAAPHYESYSYSHHVPASTSRAPRYETTEYEPKSYTRDYYHQREATSYPGKLFSFSFFLIRRVK